jgi:hypothetical protein
MKRLQVGATFLVLAMAFGGCGGLLGRGQPDPDYLVRANRDVYSRGNTGEATIRNISGESLEYNLCPRRLERMANKYWVVAFEWPTSGSACTTEARRLPRNESVNTLFEIPTGVPTGAYRIVFSALFDKEGRTVGPDQAATQSFDVR